MLYQLYLITNSINNKCYIGQTNQNKGYLKRFDEHCKAANRKNYSHSYLHNAIKHYGADNFKVKLLLHNIDEDKIDFYEILWIHKLHTHYTESGYNMTFGGDGIHGYHHTEKTKKHLHEVLSNRKCTEQELKNKKAAFQKLKNDNYFEYRKNHTDWRIKLSKKTIERFKLEENPFKNKKHSSKSKELIGRANGYSIDMLDLNDNYLLTFYSAHEATRYLIAQNKTKNITAFTRILHCCNGTYNAKTAYGYKWQYSSSVTTNPDECKDVE